MLATDVPAAHAVARAAFADLARRSGRTDLSPPGDLAAAHLRLAHLLETDPEGAWVAEREGEVSGAALSLVREGIWGLSLLVVRPEAQSAGVGRALLDRALAHADGARGGIILASEDARAMRAYARAGFALHPSVSASGEPHGVERPAGVREGGDEDIPLTAAVDRAVRGGAHGRDIAVLRRTGVTLLLAGEAAYAAVADGQVRLLAARDEESGRAVLRAALATTPPGASARVDWITARQGWALPVVLDAGLELAPAGPVFVRGELGPLTPYLPSGAYL